jgi:hypothetical protein
LPMCFNIGIIIGPMLGGLLADPAVSWPGVFGGLAWMERWRYALPNLVSAGFLAASWMAGFFFLREVRRYGISLGDVSRPFFLKIADIAGNRRWNQRSTG